MLPIQEGFWICGKGRKGASGPGEGAPRVPQVSKAWLGAERRWTDGQRQQGRARTHLGVVLSAGEQGQLVGGGEVGPDLLHLAEPLPLAPFRSPVLEPHLGARGGHGAVSKGTTGASLAGLGLACAPGWEHSGKIWSPALDTGAWLVPPAAPASRCLLFPTSGCCHQRSQRQPAPDKKCKFIWVCWCQAGTGSTGAFPRLSPGCDDAVG